MFELGFKTVALASILGDWNGKKLFGYTFPMGCWSHRFVLSLFLAANAFASDGSYVTNLGKSEEVVARQFNEMRRKLGLPALEFRRDLRIRMEACSVQTRGPDPKVERPGTKYKIWYITSDPAKPTDDLEMLSREATDRRHVAVGVWFATTQEYPNGAYWVVVYPEVSVLHEAFWTHFPLIDEGYYDTIFDKAWKKRLPERCRSLK